MIDLKCLWLTIIFPETLNAWLILKMKWISSLKLFHFIHSFFLEFIYIVTLSLGLFSWPWSITALELLDLIPASNRNSSKTNFEFSTSFLHTVNPFPISSLTLIQSLLLGGHTHTAFQITFFITLPLRFRATWNTVFVSGDKMPDAKMHKNWWPNCEDELRIGTANLIVQFWF